MADRLIIRGAREHNLRDVNLDLPRDAMIVFTGLSGSGKSSLAFDTIFAEGQRRYVESLSSYARQFLGQMDKPDVDFIEGLAPAVSIDQKSTSRNPRSTVGTITEVYDYLRLLFARVGEPHCPVCGEPITRQSPQQIVDRVLAMDEGTRFQVLAPVVRGRKGEYVDLFAELQSKGYARARVDGVVHPLTEPPKLKKQEKHTIEVVVDRLAVKATRQAAAHRLGRDRAAAWPAASCCSTSSTCPRTTEHRERIFSEHLACPNDHPLAIEDLEPRVVLLQLALRRLPGVHRPRHQEGGRPRAGRPRPGAHPARGRDRSRGPSGHDAGVLPAAARGARRRRAASTSTRRGGRCPARAQKTILLRRRTTRCTSATATSTAASAPTTPASRASMPWIERRHADTESDWSREKYEGYMREVPCPACGGARLKPEVLAVTIDGRSIAEVCGLSVGECADAARRAWSSTTGRS